jgi:thiol-disulfide isomerase/thioredoxin
VLRQFAPVFLLAAIVAVAAITLLLRQPDDGGVAQTRDVDIEGTDLPPLVGAEAADGLVVPVVSGTGFDGSSAELTRPGTATVIGFFAHWCQHCQQEVDELAGHLSVNALPDGVRVVAVSSGVRPRQTNYPPSEWFEREGWPAELLVDDSESSVAQAFGLTAFPFWVVVDADGELVDRFAGSVGIEQFELLIGSALSGKSVG